MNRMPYWVTLQGREYLVACPYLVCEVCAAGQPTDGPPYYWTWEPEALAAHYRQQHGQAQPKQRLYQYRRTAEVMEVAD